MGNKWGNRTLLAEFARRGFVAVAPQYRHCPKDIFPAQVHDVKAAVRWLRANAAEYRVDVDHVGAMGFSAGGHLSLMLGVTGPEDGLEGDVPPESPSSKVQAVVNYFGPSDLTATDVPDIAIGLVRDFLGAKSTDRPDLAAKASPVTFLSKDDAAILTFHGTKDPLVPHSQSTRLAEAMTRIGLPGRIELIVGAGHGWTGPEMKRTMSDTYEFFEEHLVQARGRDSDRWSITRWSVTDWSEIVQSSVPFGPDHLDPNPKAAEAGRGRLRAWAWVRRGRVPG